MNSKAKLSRTIDCQETLGSKGCFLQTLTLCLGLCGLLELSFVYCTAAKFYSILILYLDISKCIHREVIYFMGN